MAFSHRSRVSSVIDPEVIASFNTMEVPCGSYQETWILHLLWCGEKSSENACTADISYFGDFGFLKHIVLFFYVYQLWILLNKNNSLSRYCFFKYSINLIRQCQIIYSSLSHLFFWQETVSRSPVYRRHIGTVWWWSSAPEGTLQGTAYTRPGGPRPAPRWDGTVPWSSSPPLSWNTKERQRRGVLRFNVAESFLK